MVVVVGSEFSDRVQTVSGEALASLNRLAEAVAGPPGQQEGLMAVAVGVAAQSGSSGVRGARFRQRIHRTSL